MILFIIPSTAILANHTRAEYYAFDLNIPKSQRVTEGSNEVNYIFTIINTGNQKDTYSIYAELTEVTGCDEPDTKEWLYDLDKTIATLEPSHSEPFKLLVESGCTCQEGCKSHIAITIISETDQTLKRIIYFNTTRGPNELPPDDPGLILNVNFDPEYDLLNLETENTINFDITNTQNNLDDVYIRVSDSPANWTTSITPEDLGIYPHSREKIELKFQIPLGTAADVYKITILAQSMNNPNINHKKTVKIPVKPDIILKKVEFSKTTLRTNEEVKVSMSVENIGISLAKDIILVIYEGLNFSVGTELKQLTISELLPGKVTILYYTWKPKTVGEYYLLIQLDPNGDLDESRHENNKRIEPVIVEKGVNRYPEDPMFYYTFILILIIIFVWILIYFKYMKPKRENKK